MNFLSNDWVTWFWNTYSMAIVAVPSVIGFALKLVAIFNPNVKSDQVSDLINQYWPKGKP